MAKRRENRRHKKNVQRLLSQKAAVQRAGQPAQPPSPPSSFAHNYGPGVLLANGPLVLAAWSVPKALEEALQKNGEKVPEPIRGVLLLDTGSGGTCISIKAAESLGLKATRMASGRGAGGPTNNPVYLARLRMTIGAPDGRATTLTWEMEVQGIPDLEKHLEGRNLTYAGGPVEMIGLLGRDILRATRFQYDGLSGSLQIHFDLAAMGVLPASSST